MVDFNKKAAVKRASLSWCSLAYLAAQVIITGVLLIYIITDIKKKYVWILL